MIKDAKLKMYRLLALEKYLVGLSLYINTAVSFYESL